MEFSLAFSAVNAFLWYNIVQKEKRRNGMNMECMYSPTWKCNRRDSKRHCECYDRIVQWQLFDAVRACYVGGEYESMVSHLVYRTSVFE